jgi:phosphoglycolate phosphatase
MGAAIVFDLDGTLVDSLGDIVAAANQTLSDLGLPPLPREVIGRFVGNGLPKLVERMIRHCELPLDRHEELTKVTLAHYTAGASRTTVPYPGIPQALASLQSQGHILGVCTNKPEAPARHILDVLDLSQYFDAVLGGDSLTSRKPDPQHLFASFDALPAHGSRVFVGDSEVDAETAERAKIPFLLFTQGYRKSPVTEIPHHIAYNKAEEIPPLVAQMVQMSAQLK